MKVLFLQKAHNRGHLSHGITHVLLLLCLERRPWIISNTLFVVLTVFLPSFISPPLPGSGERLRWIQPPGAAWVLQQGGFRSVDRSPACRPSSSALYTLCMHFVCLFCLSHVLFLPACSTLSDKSPPALKQFATSEALLFLCAPFSVFKNVWECAARLYAPRLSPDFLFFSWKSCKASWIPWLDVRRSLRMCHPTTTPPQHTHTSSLHLLPDYDVLKIDCLCLY